MKQEMGPYVLVENTNFGFDQKNSSIKVTGKGVAAWLLDVVADVFQKELFSLAVKEIRSAMATTLQGKLDDELEKFGT
jgi:hypothetical protein